MRVFDDRDGVRWDVVVGRESWGSTFAIFVPRGGGAEVRQTLLDAAGTEAAERGLSALTPEQIQELLDRSEPKPMG